MDKEKILEKAIKKAIKNGFRSLDKQERIEISICLDTAKDRGDDGDKEICILYDWEVHIMEGEEVECEPWCCGKRMWFSVEELLFNHEFAKALWGVGPYVKGKFVDIFKKGGKVSFFRDFQYWEYQLMRISVERDIFEYLDNSLKK